MRTRNEFGYGLLIFTSEINGSSSQCSMRRPFVYPKKLKIMKSNILEVTVKSENTSGNNRVSEDSGQAFCFEMPKLLIHKTINTKHSVSQDLSKFTDDERALCLEYFVDYINNPDCEPSVAWAGYEWPARFILNESNLLVELFHLEDKARKGIPELWFGVALDVSRSESLWNLLYGKAYKYGWVKHTELPIKLPKSPWIAAVLNYDMEPNSINMKRMTERFILQSNAGPFEMFVAIGFAEWMKSKISN